MFPSNRYLLVAETSRAMLNRSDALAKAVQDLLSSALARQARAGDTLGIWTFDDKLHTGLIPLQQWAPGDQNAIGTRVAALLKDQKFENKPEFARLVPALQHVLKTSPFLTVMLVCSGEDEIHGTPFDARINEFFKSWRQQQAQARAPFVIALRAQAGGFVDYSMTTAPWPAELPALPKELFAPVPSPVSTPTKAPVAKATPVVPPLIVIGRKHEATPSAAKATVVGPTSPTAAATATHPAPGVETAPSDAQQAKPNTPAALVVEGQVAGPSRDANSPSPTQTPPSKPAADQVSSVSNSRLPSPPTPQQQIRPGELQTENGGSPASPPMAKDVSPGSAKAKTVPASVATVAPTRRPAGTWILALTALGSAAAALAAVCVWRRRSRSPAEPSLITESFDRRKR